MPALPPGPRTPSPVQILQWVFRPIPFMQRCEETYGAAFTSHIMGPRPFAFFSDPAAIRQIFTADPQRLQAGRANSLVFRLILGSNSLLVLDGARHRRERKLLAPPFHGDRMRLYGEMMCEITDKSIDTWPLETPFPIQPRMQDITLDIILRAVFGVDDDARHSRLRALLVEYQRVMVGRNFFLALIAWRRLTRLQRAIDSLLYDEIGRCRTEAQEGRTDIMAMLVAARDEDGRPMSDEEIRDELITMLLAGHETTAVSLAWVFHRMLQNPDVLAAARAEVAAVIGGERPRPGPVPNRLPNSATSTPSSRKRRVSTRSRPSSCACLKRTCISAATICRPAVSPHPASTLHTGGPTCGPMPRSSSPNGF